MKETYIFTLNRQVKIARNENQLSKLAKEDKRKFEPPKAALKIRKAKPKVEE